MSFIQKLVLKYLFGDQIDAILSKLPGNGVKTLVAFVATVLTIVSVSAAGADFSFLSIVDFCLTIVGQVGGESVLSQAEITVLIEAGATLVFGYHKIIKRVKRAALT